MDTRPRHRRGGGGTARRPRRGIPHHQRRTHRPHQPLSLHSRRRHHHQVRHPHPGSAHPPHPGREPGEAVLVPAADHTREDHGWLLSIVTDRTGERSDLIVLDAATLQQAAAVRLPRRVPAGFHGSWIPDV
ncbi:carotenoid oxygenase family protein [Streptomyces spinoverrucosus]|uniref:carotenoid oxygenase family protein n=1 Tax=Streptomyces spinoverrucosus TaxID=284043 RepID=UPI0027E59D20|nr:carotenoid oxygenase family protein [Streptomyces spinoverrucosus]